MIIVYKNLVSFLNMPLIPARNMLSLSLSIFSITLWSYVCGINLYLPIPQPDGIITSDINFVEQVPKDKCLTSSSHLAYSLLKAVEKNSPLIKVFDVSGSFASVQQELQHIFQQLGYKKAQLYAGSLALLVEATWYRINPLENIIAVTNAIDDFFNRLGLVTPLNTKYYVEEFVDILRSALTKSKGGAEEHARAFARGLINYLAHLGVLKPNTYHDFVSNLAGRYYEAIFTPCKPLSFHEVTPL